MYQIKNNNFHRFVSDITAGFTLIEMMTVVAIFFIVTGVILMNVPNFREKTSVDLVAQDVAVTIRSAQVFGVGTKALEGDAVSYGVNVSSDPQSNTRFVLFADRGDVENQINWSYDDSPPCGDVATECQSEYTLSGFVIKEIRYYSADPEKFELISNINILFERPKSDPYFCSLDLLSCPQTDISRVEIVIESLREQKRKSVSVYTNGQIAVADTKVPTN